MSLKVEVCNDQSTWDDYVVSYNGHPLQLWGWGEVKAAHGWQVQRVFIYDDDRVIGAAQILLRHLPWPLNYLAYIPRGPVADSVNREDVLRSLADHVKLAHKAAVLTIEPDWNEMPANTDWKPATNTILIPRTLILDLAQTEEELLAHMTKKTRQYIRKSTNENITVRKVANREELTACLGIYKQTAKRAGFAIHGDDYYYDIYDKLGEYSPVFAAFLKGQPVAFLWLAISGQTSFELYGGMDDDGQLLRANYTLKWHAIQTMKKWGISRYDFNGLLNDGVSTFKQGFSDHETILVGTYDKPLSSLYVLWSKGLPIAKKVIRTIKRR